MLKRVDYLHAQGNTRIMPREKKTKGENDGQLIGDVMEIHKNISSCLASDNAWMISGLKLSSKLPTVASKS